MSTKTIWEIDPLHSQIQFKVRHLVISNVTGKFNKFSATMETDGDDVSTAKINFEADTNSVDTGIGDRDNHLKGNDFFDAENHPKISFRSKKVEKTGDDTYKLTGDLTIRNTTKEITLDVEHGGIMVDMYGRTVAGFELTGKINRKEFGLTWSGMTESGGVVVSDDVKLNLNVEMVKK